MVSVRCVPSFIPPAPLPERGRGRLDLNRSPQMTPAHPRRRRWRRRDYRCTSSTPNTFRTSFAPSRTCRSVALGKATCSVS